MLHLHLRDTNRSVVEALEREFAGLSGVTVSHGNILECSADAIVSPANSFGYMDDGIDLAYAKYFGFGFEDRLRALLIDQHFGELPVGQALLVETMHASIPLMICAPTMRVPGSISRTVNTYLAGRAAFITAHRAAATAGHEILELLMPGLGTGVGEMPPGRAARQMRLAYDAIVLGQWGRSRNAGQIWGEHADLLL